jgi:prepilin-type N-terminal cleavage/methylation domain-containing protein
MVKAKAFTLIEILVVIGIFLMLSVSLVPYSIAQINKARVDSSAKLLMVKLYTQQQNSYSQTADLSYGIVFNDTSYTLYSGYATDNLLNTETLNLENGVRITTLQLQNPGNKIYFPFGTVKPDNYGVITVSDGSQSYKIEINQEGMVNYYKQ